MNRKVLIVNPIECKEESFMLKYFEYIECKEVKKELARLFNVDKQNVKIYFVDDTKKIKDLYIFKEPVTFIEYKLI